MFGQITLGFVISALIGFIGYRKKTLSKSGALGAILTGTPIFGFGGWQWGVLLIAFFISSSFLSIFKSKYKEKVSEKFDKGHQRDWAQALANGGLGALMAIGHGLLPSPLWWVAFVGAIATVNADTWATELGVLSQRQPRLITTGKRVPPGTSGGITVSGSLAAFFAALLIAILAALLSFDEIHSWVGIIFAGSFAGFLGAMVDSFIGATGQLMYQCPNCGQKTEQKFHHVCQDIRTKRISGISWLNNDAVNFISSAAGASFSLIIWLGFLQI